MRLVNPILTLTSTVYRRNRYTSAATITAAPNSQPRTTPNRLIQSHLIILTPLRQYTLGVGTVPQVRARSLGANLGGGAARRVRVAGCPTHRALCDEWASRITSNSRIAVGCDL